MELRARSPSCQFFKVRSQKKPVRVCRLHRAVRAKRIGQIRALKMRHRRKAINSARARPSAQLFGIRSVERAFLSGRATFAGVRRVQGRSSIFPGKQQEARSARRVKPMLGWRAHLRKSVVVSTYNRRQHMSARFTFRNSIAAMLAAPALVGAGTAYAACTGLGAPADTETKCLTAVQIPGAALRSYDISWVNPHRAEYYLADRSNAAIDIIDTHNRTFKRFLGKGLFVGVKLSNAGTP